MEKFPVKTSCASAARAAAVAAVALACAAGSAAGEAFFDIPPEGLGDLSGLPPSGAGAAQTPEKAPEKAAEEPPAEPAPPPAEESDEPAPGEIRSVKQKISAASFFGGDKSMVSVSGDGRSASLSGGEAAGRWARMFHSREGYLKPGAEYRISFKYRASEIPPGGVLMFCARDMDPKREGPLDLASLSETEVSEEFSTGVLRFRIPPGSRRVSFQAHAYGPLKAEISDIVVERGDFDDYYPASARAAPDSAPAFAGAPAGASEFGVDAPAPSGDVFTLFAPDPGDPDGARFVSDLNRAIEKCREMGIGKLSIAGGVWRVTEEKPITLEGMSDFTLDGGGATLVFLRKTSSSMRISGCERVKVENLNFDWDWERDPLGSYVRVAGVRESPREESVDFEFVDYSSYPLEEPRVASLSPVDPISRDSAPGKSFYWEAYDSSAAVGKKWVSPSVLRVYPPAGQAAGFKKGQMYRMLHYHRHMNCVEMASNRHLTLRNVNVFSSPGSAFTVGGAQSFWQFENVNVRIPSDGVKRAVTCTSDGLNVSRSKGFFKMSGCDFSFTGGDCANIHDITDFATALGRGSLLSGRRWTFAAGDPVELLRADYSPTGFVSKVKAIRPHGEPGARQWEIETDSPIPTQFFGGFVLLNRAYGTKNVIVRDCTFRQNGGAGLLILAGDVTVDGCRFFRNADAAVRIEAVRSPGSRCEGYGVSNAVVRNCEFDSPNLSGAESSGKPRDVFVGACLGPGPHSEPSSYPAIRDVLFEGNDFRGSSGLAAFAASSKNIAFAGNTFSEPSPRGRGNHMLGAVYAVDSEGVRMTGNIYVKSPLVKNPGLFADKPTVTGVVFAGNAVVGERGAGRAAPAGQAAPAAEAPPGADGGGDAILTRDVEVPDLSF